MSAADDDDVEMLHEAALGRGASRVKG
jgi:hypothetical protein